MLKYGIFKNTKREKKSLDWMVVCSRLGPFELAIWLRSEEGRSGIVATAGSEELRLRMLLCV